MCGYFGTKKKIVLLNYPLVLSLLKYMNVWVFWNKKNLVQTDIYIYIYIYIYRERERE